MSGGHWNYQDTKIADELPIHDIVKIMDALRRCFHEIDWSESADTARKTAEMRIYDILLTLGDQIWGTD